MVNTGAMFELLSNSQFPSTVHRVHTKVSFFKTHLHNLPYILTLYPSQSGVERFSFPIFFSPDPSAFLQPHPSLLKEGEETKQPSFYIGKRYISGLLHNSPDHPWCKKLKASGIKEEDYKWELLMEPFPEVGA